MIKDAISVLEEHVKTEADAVDTTLEEYRKLVAQLGGDVKAAADPGAPSAPGTTPAVVHRRAAPTTPRRRGRGRHKPRARRRFRREAKPNQALEEGRQRTLQELHNQLAQAQLTLTPQHPTSSRSSRRSTR